MVLRHPSTTRTLLVVSTGLAGCSVLLPAILWAQSGLEIMRQQRQLSRVQDEEETMVMKVMDKSGAAKERRIVWYTRTDPQDLNKILMRFLSPRDLENTGLLTWEKRDGDDDQWLYLPATKKVTRIAASGKKSRFMGTDFAFEDLRSENLALYTYTLTGTETIDGQACYIIEAV